MGIPKTKLVNPNDIQYGVNSLRLVDLHMLIAVIGIFVLPSFTLCVVRLALQIIHQSDTFSSHFQSVRSDAFHPLNHRVSKKKK